MLGAVEEEEVDGEAATISSGVTQLVLLIAFSDWSVVCCSGNAEDKEQTPTELYDEGMLYVRLRRAGEE